MNSSGHSATSLTSQFVHVPDSYQPKNPGIHQPPKDLSHISSLHNPNSVHKEHPTDFKDHPSHPVAIVRQRMDHIPQDFRNESEIDAEQSGSNLFRNRANRGRSHDPTVSTSNRFAPYNVPPRRDPEVMHSELDSFNIANEDLLERSRPTVMKPIVYEYHHQPSQYGRYSAFENQLKCFDYSHCSRSETDEHRLPNTDVMFTCERPQSATKSLVEKPKENQPAKPAQLFPSAASIELNSTSALKPCFSNNTNENREGKAVE